MNPEERGKLLRERFKAVGRFPYVSSGEAKPATAENRSVEFRTHFALAMRYTIPRKKWMETPDEPQHVELAVKRQKRVSPLTKIAAQWHSPSWRESTKRKDLHHA